MKLIGMEKESAAGLRALQRGQPILYYGFTGNGKTLLAWEVAKKYAKEVGSEQAYRIVYLQLYPEMTKNSLIGGETLRDGSIVIEEQAILKMGQKGAIFIVDECTHTTEPVLLSFNSLIEEPYSTVVGDQIYKLHEKTRFIFCGNLPDHTGNIHLPISFANRVFIIKTGLPNPDALVDIGIEASPETPEEILRFLAGIIEKTHDPTFPISPRNMVTVSRSICSIFKTGYKEISPFPERKLAKICKKFDINLDLLKETIISSMMGNLVCKSQGPDKIKALLWD